MILSVKNSCPLHPVPMTVSHRSAPTAVLVSTEVHRERRSQPGCANPDSDQLSSIAQHRSKLHPMAEIEIGPVTSHKISISGLKISISCLKISISGLKILIWIPTLAPMKELMDSHSSSDEGIGGFPQ